MKELQQDLLMKISSKGTGINALLSKLNILSRPVALSIYVLLKIKQKRFELSPAGSEFIIFRNGM